MARILCLDDDPEMLRMYRLILERADYECLTTADKQEALSIMRTQSIDLLIQDVMRPGMSGFEFLSVMKSDEALRSIPVLLISGRGLCNPEEWRRFGVDPDRDLAGYIPKPPIPAKKLLNTIEAILEKGPKPPSAE